MAGILDFLTGNNAAASPWGMLYQAPPVAGGQSEQERRAQEAAAFGALGIDPAALPQKSPFDAPASPIPSLPGMAMPSPAPSPFAPAPAANMGTGAPTAAPFSFAGAGSNIVNPSSIVAPPPAFGAGAQPVPFAAGPVTQQPPAGPSTDLSSVNRDRAPDDFIPVGGYQMPAFRGGAPAVAGADDDEAIPANAAPTSGAIPPAAPAAPSPAAPFSLGGSGIGDRLMKGTRGFMGNMAGGPIGALMGGLGALVTGQNTDPTSIASEKLAATGQALVKKGAPIEDVRAAVNNPALMTALLQQYYGKDKYKVQQTGENWLGGKTFQLFNETDGTFKPIPNQAGGGAAGADGTAPLMGDPTKTGRDYLATVPQAQRGTVAGVVDGTIAPPTSMAAAKPYWQAIIREAKQADPTFDESNWAARRKMRVDIASSGNSSMGGILSNGMSAFEHLKTYSDKLADVGNYNGPDVPGGATIADVGNFVGNRLLPRAATLDKISGANSAGLKYGQESTKFYAGSGGGEGERTAALHNNDARSTTAAQQAGFLQTEKELMLGRLREKENQIRGTLGDGYLQQHPVMTPELQQTIAHIDANIARLRGTAPAAGAAPAAPSAAPVAGGTVNIGGKPISWKVN